MDGFAITICHATQKSFKLIIVHIHKILLRQFLKQHEADLGQDIWFQLDENLFVVVSFVKDDLVTSAEQTRVAHVHDEMSSVHRTRVLL